ncbi:MAG: hypothetical protein ABUK08_07265, partial [Candidatus Humimicrobiaceae bacterium]
MVNEYKMKHAKKRAFNWKIIIIIISSLAVLAVAYVIYWYFPTILKFIDNKVLSLFSGSSGTIVEEAITEDNPGGIEDNIEISGQEEPEEEPVEEIVEEEESAEEEDENNKSLPTISIRIYEGPLYSKSDDICYYRIIADVSGEPFPEVIFSKDDSLGSLGPDKVQINIHRDSTSYTLSATAKNSEGTASDSITLMWNCNRSPDISGIQLSTDTLYVGEQYEVSTEVVDLDGDDLIYSWSVSGGSLEEISLNPTKWNTPNDPGDYTISINVTDGAGNTSTASVVVYVGTIVVNQTPVNLNLPRKENEGGYIELGGGTFVGGDIYAGDSNSNKPCSGFISFDISGLAGKTVDSATLTFSNSSVSGDPLSFFESLWINVLDWGAEPISQNDFNLSGIPIASYNTPN